MKILMLCDFFGDNQTYQENFLLKYYKKLGHNVVVIAALTDNIFDYYSGEMDKNLPQKEYQYESATIYRLPYQFNFKDKLKKLSGVKEILEKEKPDLIFCHGIHLNLKEASNYKKQNRNVKIILDCHGDYSNSAKNWISTYILNKFLRRAFITKYKSFISQFYAIVPEGIAFMNELYGIDKKKIELLPLGCDYDYMQEIKQNSDKIEIKKQLGISPEDFVIVSGGKFTPQKKTEILIEAVKLLKNKKIHLLLFGTSDKSQLEYFNFIQEIAKENKVELFGWLSSEKIYELMLVSDIAVFPSSQSVLWQQSIGMGLPVIAGDSGGQDMSYLNVNENLIKVEKQNINADYFAKLISEIIDSPQKLESMKNGAEKTAKEFLNYRYIAEKTLESTESNNRK